MTEDVRRQLTNQGATPTRQGPSPRRSRPRPGTGNSQKRRPWPIGIQMRSLCLTGTITPSPEKRTKQGDCRNDLFFKFMYV